VHADEPANPRVALEIVRALQHPDRHFFELERQLFVGGLTRKFHQVMRMHAKVNDQILLHAAAGPKGGIRPESSTAFVESYHARGDHHV